MIMKYTAIKILIPLISLTVTSCNQQKGPKGYVQAEKMTILSQDLKNAYAPALGDVKLLVVPITFAGSTASGHQESIQPWTEKKISDVNKYYFGETNSLAAYYRTASFNKLRITGMVSDIYQNTTLSVSTILNDGSMERLRDLMDDALNWLHDTATNINWQEYDLNQDGCIDNIHFITDYCSQEWNTNLWPHMFWTNRKGTIERPMVNVYSMSGTAFVTNAITAIHEQGHIFGLDDYYDYSDNGQSPIDYIGQLDMQSHNVFDWNSFSKLTTGWVNPYVIDGSEKKTKITLKAASLNGDCLIIPANYDTWNGSAFDEYFLIELFAPFGNNEKDWKKYTGKIGSDPGVRMYHVDARAYGSDKTDPYNQELLIVDNLEEQEINSVEDCAKYKYITRGANNCSNWRDYEGGIEQLKDHPLLSIVQKKGDFTFAKKDSRNHALSTTDLFKEGDVFTFEKYSHFLNKQAKIQSTMDNGEEFPYEIYFGEITEDSITITVTKVK